MPSWQDASNRGPLVVVPIGRALHPRTFTLGDAALMYIHGLTSFGSNMMIY